MQHFITVYTDASFCPKTKVGGWAMWVKHGDGEILRDSWAFKNPVENSSEAELMAIANAVYLVCKNLDITGKIIVVVTDSQIAIDFLTKDVKWKNKAASDMMNAIATKIKNMVVGKCAFRVKKVKAHSKADGKRSYVNDLVDKAARKAMIDKRKELLNANNIA